jgi:uncharacterized repeat protein (TIGR03803 family)
MDPHPFSARRRSLVLGAAAGVATLGLSRPTWAAPRTAAGWTFEALHGFSWAEGSRAVGSVTFGHNGMLYGVHAAGGEQGLGTLFRWSPADGSFTVLQHFAYSDNGPSAPESGLVLGSDGQLWGTSSFGGATFRGTIYALDAVELLTMRHEFGVSNELWSPQGALVEGPAGVFHGTTRDAVYRFNASTGRVKEVYRFRDGLDGRGCESALVHGPDGRMYGVNPFGGPGNKPTIFSLNPNGSGFKVLKTLTHAMDGAGLAEPLVLARDGWFYGCATSGGAFNRGVAFRLSPAGAYEVIHHFAGGDNDGAYPRCALVEGPDGALYGTTVEGGDAPQSYGTIFRMTRSGKVRLLHRFDADGAGGSTPVGALRFGPDGWLYGTNQGGSGGSTGVLYRLRAG